MAVKSLSIVISYQQLKILHVKEKSENCNSTALKIFIGNIYFSHNLQAVDTSDNVIIRTA